VPIFRNIESLSSKIAMKAVATTIFSVISVFVIFNFGVVGAQQPESTVQVTCVLFKDENLAVVKAVEQFTTAPLFCEGHEKTISVLLSLGYHIAGANQFEVFMTK
jgi:hypothetical protein